MKKSLLQTIAILSFAALFCLFVMYLVFAPSEDEVARVPSPDKKFEAVLTEINGGATTSFGYSIYIVKRGQSTFWHKSVAYLYGAIRNNNAYGINLKWNNPGELAIEYLKAQSADLIKSNIEIDSSVVKVFLKSDVTDESAPPGGMLYNLKQKTKVS